MLVMKMKKFLQLFSGDSRTALDNLKLEACFLMPRSILTIGIHNQKKKDSKTFLYMIIIIHIQNNKTFNH